MRIRPIMLAITLFSGLLLVGCHSPEKLVQNGDTFTVSGNFAQAQKSYESALEAKPNFVPALVGLGKMNEVQEMQDEALNWYNKAINAKAENDPERKQQTEARDAIAKIHLDRGEQHQLKKRNKQAIEEYDKALAVKPKQAIVDELNGRIEFIEFQRYKEEVVLPRFPKVEEQMRKAKVQVIWVPETQIFVSEGSVPFDEKKWKGKTEDDFGPVMQKEAHDFVVKEMTRYAFALAQVPQEQAPDYKAANFTIRGQQWVGSDYVIQTHFTRDEMFTHAFRIEREARAKK